MSGLKAVLFDNDGTLADSRDLILASFRHTGPVVLGRQFSDAEYLQKVGQPLAVQVRDFTDDPQLQERFCEVYRAHNQTVHDQMIKVFPGTNEALAKFAAAGLKLGVVTSKRHAVAWHGLEVVGAAPYLDCCVGWDDIERPKPDPQPVERGCDLLGFAPDECLYVGDAPFDIQAGNAAGVKTAAVTWGMFDEACLIAESPTFVAHTWDELVEGVSSLR